MIRCCFNPDYHIFKDEEGNIKQKCYNCGNIIEATGLLKFQNWFNSKYEYYKLKNNKTIHINFKNEK